MREMIRIASGRKLDEDGLALVMETIGEDIKSACWI